MQPVIPRIRVGDVLLGTKNLRNWLQTKSLLAYTRKLTVGMRVNNEKLYIPRKRDSFVVVVNAWETFAACNFEAKVTILFANPVQQVTHERGEPRMGPSQFATWFIRTRGKRPDLRCWPEWAYYLWASVHMNLMSSRNYQLTYYLPPEEDATFQIANHNEADRDSVRKHLYRAIRAGETRRKPRRRASLGESHGYGPKLEDILRDQETLRQMVKNPRLEKRVKSAVPTDLGIFWDHVVGIDD